MASEIAGRPHWEVDFDEHGKPDRAGVDALLAELPGEDLTDLFVFAHGWNSDFRQARRLYQLYFQQVPGLLAQGGGQAARVGTLGVVWPSKRWADEPEPTGGVDGGGAAAGSATARSPRPRPPTRSWSRTSRTCSGAPSGARSWTSWPGCWRSGPRTRPPWPGSRR